MKIENTGTTSLVLGILGLVFCLAPFSFILDIIAIVKAKGLNTGNANAGRTMAIIGIVINGLITLIIIPALLIGMASVA